MPRAIWIMIGTARTGATGPAVNQGGERLAVEQLHHDVGSAVFTFPLVEESRSRWDARATCALLASRTKSLAHLRVRGEARIHHLDGAGAVDQLVLGSVDGRHPAFAQHVLDHVAAARSSCR